MYFKVSEAEKAKLRIKDLGRAEHERLLAIQEEENRIAVERGDDPPVRKITLEPYQDDFQDQTGKISQRYLHIDLEETLLNNTPGSKSHETDTIVIHNYSIVFQLVLTVVDV